MTVVLEEARGELLPTATYSHRSWQWRADIAVHLVTRDGTLTILQTRGRRVLRTEVSHYAVQAEHDEYLPAGVRAFLLENELEPDEFGPFRCVVGEMGESCGCEAGWLDRRREVPTGCKHRAALGAMLAEGVFDNLDNNNGG